MGKKLTAMLLMICLLLTGCFGRQVTGNLDKYEDHRQANGGAKELMPALDSLSGYEKIGYAYQYTTELIFYTDAMTLLVQYDEQTYGLKKEEALAAYTFLEEPVMSYDEEEYIIPVAEFEYQGYRMRFVEDPEWSGHGSCKSFLMLGLNDEQRTIAYLYHYDVDLDYIALVSDDPVQAMVDYVDTYFTWPEPV